MRDILTSPRVIEIKHTERVKRTRLLILFLILFISIIAALAYYSNDSHVVINKIVISGTHIIDSDEVEKEVWTNMDGRYFHLFAKINSLIYPRQNIYNDLIQKFPRIENLSVYRDNLRTLNIDITERTGSYLYCGSSIPTNPNDVGENCYYINNDGYIFDKAPYFSGNIYFKYYLALGLNLTNPLGHQMIPMDDFHNMTRFIDGITALGFKPIYLASDPDGTYYLYLDHGSADTAPTITFKKENDLNIILDNLSLSMKKTEFADEINSKYTTLLYIDLRFKNKVLYKFQ